MTAPTSVYPRPAAEPGALDGWAFRCPRCHAEHTTSLSAHHARILASEHEDWHRRQASMQANKPKETR